MVFNNESGTGDQETWSNASVRFFTGNGTDFVNTAAGSLSYTLSKVANQNLFVYEHNSTARTVYIDGAQDATSASPANVSTTASIAALGRRYNNVESHASVLCQELIHYPINQSSNRKAIETDIDSYYRIYGDPDDGLLSTPYGTGAAAAYSVRRLSNNATRAMRILVDADANGPDASDNEYDIGFDANGELDIAKIEELCDKGTGNYDAYVTTWYDQSGEGNDATQATYSAMPKICNAGTVITEHAKPALQGGSGVYLTQPSAVSVSDDLTLLAVADTSNLTTTQLILGVETDTCATDTQIFTDTNGSRINGRNAICGFVHSTKSGNSSLFLGVFDYTNDQLVARYDGVAQTTVSGLTETPTTIDWNIGTSSTSGAYNLGTCQEVIIWTSAKNSENSANIESNINDYFNIEGV